jgi:hypothetical protein
MVARSILEKVPSDRISDTISMDLTNSGQRRTQTRAGAYANKNYCGKDASDWKVVTPLALEDLRADSPFFASNPSRVLPCFDAKGEGWKVKVNVMESWCFRRLPFTSKPADT